MANEGFEYVWTDKKRTIFGLPWSFTRYYLTPTKFICRTGFLNLEEDEIDLYKITDKKLCLPFGQRLFGCGTIHICSRDTDSPEKDVVSIKRPREVMQLLDKYITEQRDRYNIRGRDMLGMPHMHHDDGLFDYDSEHPGE
ncbi:MAG: PH domain-containing protein [Oscillospiraceae bacterium]|nr:PH domain-containing protein [Oscillospiraceae bacterium]